MTQVISNDVMDREKANCKKIKIFRNPQLIHFN